MPQTSSKSSLCNENNAGACRLRIPAEMQGEPAEAVAVSMARCLSETGCLIVRDPRVGKAENETFLNLMEEYFDQPEEVKLRDARPELHYQVGNPWLQQHGPGNMPHMWSELSEGRSSFC